LRSSQRHGREEKGQAEAAGVGREQHLAEKAVLGLAGTAELLV
jgi:hypothetical protein